VSVGDWRDEAACSGAPDPDVWFSAQPDEQAAALAVCDFCPVWEACLHAALTLGTPEGIWGGYGPQDRADLRVVSDCQGA
jgi:WhiB family redox-sensing transcriptional regulator